MDNDNAIMDFDRFPEIKYLREKAGICIEAPSVTGNFDSQFTRPGSSTRHTQQSWHNHNSQILKIGGNSTVFKNFEVIFAADFAPTTLNKFYVNSSSQFDLLQKSFDKELLSYNQSLNLSLDIIRKEFTKTALILSELKFDNGIVEFIESVGFRFTMLFPGGRMLLITKSVNENHELKGSDILYSFFINRDLIATDAMELRTFVEGFKEYLNM